MNFVPFFALSKLDDSDQLSGLVYLVHHRRKVGGVGVLSNTGVRGWAEYESMLNKPKMAGI